MISNRLKQDLSELESGSTGSERIRGENFQGERFQDERFSSGRSLLNLLFTGDLVAKDKALAFLPFFLFLALLVLFYIGNRHFAEKKTRLVIRLTSEIKELKWEYTSTKASLMLQSKQSEVALRGQMLGLKESVSPPYKILIRTR